MGTRFLPLAATIFALFLPPALAQEIDVAAVAATARAGIGAALAPANLAGLEAVAAADIDAEATEGLAIATLINRHLDESAWLYALAVERDPTSANLITSFGALGRELGLQGRPVASLDNATLTALHRAALSFEPDDAAIKLNLATALMDSGLESGLEEAIPLLEEAFAFDPANSLYGARLAKALNFAGREDEARDVLNRAFVLDPVSVPVSMANNEIFDGAGISPPEALCSIDFNCAQKCPKGIIGQVNYVACMEANVSANGACSRGEAFPTSYDCEAKMPAFGILVPGLDPGFTILTPWGSLDMLVQGDGRIDAKIRWNGLKIPDSTVKAPFIEARGSWNPNSGEYRIEGSTGYSIGIPSTGNEVADSVNSFGFGPSIRIQYNVWNPPNGRLEEPSLRLFRGKVIG